MKLEDLQSRVRELTINKTLLTPDEYKELYDLIIQSNLYDDPAYIINMITLSTYKSKGTEFHELFWNLKNRSNGN